MNAENFQFLLDLVGPAIAKQDTLMRESVNFIRYRQCENSWYVRELGAHDPYVRPVTEKSIA